MDHELSFEASIYLEEYYRHLAAGDDPMNARLRIIEQGCPIELADKIQKASERVDSLDDNEE